VSTKTPSTKAKKPAAKPAAKPAKKGPAGEDEAKKKRAAKAAKPGGARDEEDGEGEGDEDEDDEEEFLPKKSGKPAAEPTAVVPARRLTPEAKAAINAMVAKGVPLDEALRRAGSWETFVAPVKDETQKQFPGKEGGGPRSPFGGRRPSGPRDKDKSEMPREPGSGFGGFDDDDAGISLGDDEPIVAGGDDD
jgi:hypothetical protein